MEGYPPKINKMLIFNIFLPQKMQTCSSGKMLRIYFFKKGDFYNSNTTKVGNITIKV